MGDFYRNLFKSNVAYNGSSRCPGLQSRGLFLRVSQGWVHAGGVEEGALIYSKRVTRRVPHLSLTLLCPGRERRLRVQHPLHMHLWHPEMGEPQRDQCRQAEAMRWSQPSSPCLVQVGSVVARCTMCLGRKGRSRPRSDKKGHPKTVQMKQQARRTRLARL